MSEACTRKCFEMRTQHRRAPAAIRVTSLKTYANNAACREGVTEGYMHSNRLRSHRFDRPRDQDFFTFPEHLGATLPSSTSFPLHTFRRKVGDTWKCLLVIVKDKLTDLWGS